jgi:hypothetical protein
MLGSGKGDKLKCVALRYLETLSLRSKNLNKSVENIVICNQLALGLGLGWNKGYSFVDRPLNELYIMLKLYEV